EKLLCKSLLDALAEIPGITIYGPKNANLQTATVSINMDGYSPAELGLALYEEFGILCRAGLHCAPAAHRTLGTFPTGSVRISMGVFHQREDVEYLVNALEKLSEEKKP